MPDLTPIDEAEALATSVLTSERASTQEVALAEAVRLLTTTLRQVLELSE
jgi:hypothetical protein